MAAIRSFSGMADSPRKPTIVRIACNTSPSHDSSLHRAAVSMNSDRADGRRFS
jgi:hypothetical protein